MASMELTFPVVSPSVGSQVLRFTGLSQPDRLIGEAGLLRDG